MDKHYGIFQKYSSFKYQSLISFRTLQIGCLWLLSDNLFGDLPKIYPLTAIVCFPTGHLNFFFFRLYRTKTSDVLQKFSPFNCHCLLSYRTPKKLFFELYRTKTSDIVQKFLSFKCHCLFSFRTLKIGCLWILSDIYFGYLPKIFIFCHCLLSYQTLKKKLFFGLYRTKTSDVFQKFSSFKYHCLLSYRTLKKVVFRIVLDKNFGYLPKIFIFKCHCLLSSRTLTISCFLDCIGQKLRTSSKYICLLRATVCFFYRTVKISCCLWIVSYGNATK